MEQLPLEVLECIVSYLSDEDLSRCCTVSTSWREAFNDNMFWRKRCNIKLSDYLESANCMVEPFFTTPCVQNSSLMPLSGWRLSFLREQHYLKNLRSGRYKREEIEFDCDDNFSYNVKLEFVGNDYVFLHSTFETQVWNVAQKPNLVMSIPFQLVELWERNTYQFHENKLIVVQSNVVQMFNVCLHSKTWSFHRTFFFDRPEEYSLKITKDTDVNDMFKNVSYEVGDSVERVVCGNFLIGIVTTKTALQNNPVMHIWDLNSCKKIKEEICSEHFGSDIRDVYFKTSTYRDKIIVVCQLFQKKCFAVYSLANLSFLASYQCRNGDSLLCDEYLFIYDNSTSTILRYDLDSNVVENVYKFDQGRLVAWHVFCDQIVVTNSSHLILINPLSKIVEVQSYNDILIKNVDVVKDKCIAIHDREGSFRQLWEYRAGDTLKRMKGNAFEKLFSLPPDSGTYRTANEVCSKIALERANKVIVLNFW